MDNDIVVVDKPASIPVSIIDMLWLDSLKCFLRRSVGEWLGFSLALLGVDGSSLLIASQRYNGLNSPYA